MCYVLFLYAWILIGQAFMDTYLAMYSFVPLFREVKFCGVPSCVWQIRVCRGWNQLADHCFTQVWLSWDFFVVRCDTDGGHDLVLLGYYSAVRGRICSCSEQRTKRLGGWRRDDSRFQFIEFCWRHERTKKC
jgi:hypothetical protein